MKTGASTSCLFPMLTEQAFEHLLKLGVKNIELFFNSPSERTPEFIKPLAKAADEMGAKIVSVHPYSSEMEGVGFFGKYPRRFDDEAEDYRYYFEACASLGAEIFVFHGARSFLTLEKDFYFERFWRLNEIARSFGVRLCQENVARCHSGRPEFISEMRKALPDVGFVLDVKQAVRAKVTPFDMLEAMGDNLAHLHLSDHNAECDCLAPGEGEFDLERFAQRLKAANYSGKVIVELYSWYFSDESQLIDGIKLFDKYFI